jgi:hypothetical protein
LNTLNNTSTCSGYTSFSSLSTTLTKGNTYTATIIPSTTTANAQGAYTGDELAIWIDYNNDNDFLDAGEQVAYVIVAAGWSNVFNFTVPTSATTGSVKMRVRSSYQPNDGTIAPCGVTTYGEVEDYSVVIQSSGVGIEDLNALNAVQLFPNPVSKELIVDLSAVAGEEVTIELFDLFGKLIATSSNQNGSSVTIAMNGFANGMYQVKLSSGEAQITKRIIKL